MTIQDLDKKILKTVLYLNCQGCNRTKIKNKKGVFVMDTKMMSQFEIMDTDMLACVEGGRKFGDCETAIAAGIGVGAIFAGPLGGIGLGMVAAAYYC